jgi:hypothetical protein
MCFVCAVIATNFVSSVVCCALPHAHFSFVTCLLVSVVRDYVLQLRVGFLSVFKRLTTHHV